MLATDLLLNVHSLICVTTCTFLSRKLPYPTRALLCHVHRVRIGSILECFFHIFFGLYFPAPSISDHFPTCKFAIFIPNILAIYNFSENFHSKLLPTLTQLENYVGYNSGLQHTFPVLIKVSWSEQCCGTDVFLSIIYPTHI